MPKKKLAIFDMDGTLVDTKDVNFYAYKEALEDSSAEELKEKEIIVRIGSNKTGYWKIQHK